MARPGEGDRVGDQPACRGLAPVHPAEVCVTFDQTSLAIDPRPGRGPCENEAARQNLERRIASHLSSGRLALGITDNNFTMISVRRDRGPVYRVRLHHMFVTAPPTVTRALARYIAENEFQASRFLTRYIEENQHAIRRAARRRAPAPTPSGRASRSTKWQFRTVTLPLSWICKPFQPAGTPASANPSIRVSTPGNAPATATQAVSMTGAPVMSSNVASGPASLRSVTPSRRNAMLVAMTGPPPPT
jgi:hypothetical protein